MYLRLLSVGLLCLSLLLPVRPFALGGGGPIAFFRSPFPLGGDDHVPRV